MVKSILVNKNQRHGTDYRYPKMVLIEVEVASDLSHVVLRAKGMEDIRVELPPPGQGSEEEIEVFIYGTCNSS